MKVFKDKVGTKKKTSLFAWQDGKCIICAEKLEFFQSDVCHIVAQRHYIENGIRIDNTLGNLFLAHRQCNKAMATSGIEFLHKSFVAKIAERNSQIAKADNPNDLRSILKSGLTDVNGNLIDSKSLDRFADTLAKSNVSKQFSKKHKQGLYYRP